MTSQTVEPIAAEIQYRTSAAHRAADARYRQSPKGKAYRKSSAYRASLRRYNQSPKGKAAHKRHESTEKYKATCKRIRQTDRYKAYHQKYEILYIHQRPYLRTATRAVRSAIDLGKLAPLVNLQCHYCSEPAKVYHHYLGYEPKHWLDVVPVCIKCHVKVRSTGRRKDTYEHTQNLNH